MDRLICMYIYIYVSFIVHRDVGIIILKWRKLLFLIKSFSSALIRSISFSRFHSRIKCMTIRASMSKPMWASLTGGIGSERCGLLRRWRCRSFLLGLEFLDCVERPAKLPSLIVNRVRAAINQRCGSLHTAFTSIAGDVDDFDLRITVFWNDFVPYAILFLPVPGFLSSIYS